MLSHARQSTWETAVQVVPSMVYDMGAKNMVQVSLQRREARAVTGRAKQRWQGDRMPQLPPQLQLKRNIKFMLNLAHLCCRRPLSQMTAPELALWQTRVSGHDGMSNLCTGTPARVQQTELI